MNPSLDPPGSPSGRARWIPIATWGLLVLIAVATAFDAWRDIAQIATTDEEQSHVVLVPVVALWMAWARRARLRNFRPQGTLAGPAVIAVGWAMSAYGYYNATQALWHLGAVLMLAGAIVTGIGANALLRFFPAFAVLAFLVPIPGMLRQTISGPMQTSAAYATQIILETFGVPIERSTNLLTINGQDVAVAEACNGMRMVLALVLVSYTFAFSMPFRSAARILILAGSPIAALACNIIRLIPTVLLYGYATKPTADAWHDIAGWLMLPFAFFLLLGITAALRWALIPVTRFTLAYQ
jgi:exosortase